MINACKANMQLLPLLAGTMALGALFGAPNAQAEDRKTYLGSSCVQLHDSTPSIQYDYDGDVHNDSGETKEFACSLVRDNTGSDMNINDWEVTVKRGDGWEYGDAVHDPWAIELWSLSQTGLSGYKSTINVPVGIGNQTLDGGSINSALSLGTLMIRTLIPAGAFILSYNAAAS